MSHRGPGDDTSPPAITDSQQAQARGSTGDTPEPKVQRPTPAAIVPAVLYPSADSTAVSASNPSAGAVARAHNISLPESGDQVSSGDMILQNARLRNLSRVGPTQ